MSQENQKNKNLYKINRRNLLIGSGVGMTSIGGTRNDHIKQVFSNKKQIWKFETDGKIDSSPTIVNGTVFIGSYDNRLYAINSDTGEQVWKFNTGGKVNSSPAFLNNSVYIGSLNWKIYKIDPDTGDEIWGKRIGSGSIRSSPTVVDINDITDFDELDNSSGESIESIVYYGDTNGDVYSVEDGPLKRWEFSTANWIESSPTVVNKTVFIGSWDGYLYAIDANTGDRIWTFDTGQSGDERTRGIDSSPTVSDGTVFVGSDSKAVFALDTTTGEKIWKYETSGPVKSSPTVAAGTVYCADLFGSVYAINANTGKETWVFESGDVIVSSPTIADGTIFIGGRKGRLYGINAETGNEVWGFETGSRIGSSPTVVNGTVFVGNDDGVIYALDATIEGSSEGSRVNLGTLGHHHVWADTKIDEPDQPSKTGTVAGTVINPEETPVADATIKFVSETTSAITVATNAEGKFDVELDSKTYQMEIEKEGYEPFSTEVTVDPDTTVSVNPELSYKKGTVTGVVSDSEGDPVADASIEFISDDTTETSIASDSEGEFNVELDSKTYQMEIEKEGYEPFSTEVTVDSSTPQSVDPVLTLLDDEVVMSINNNVQADATVRLIGKGVYTDKKSEGRVITEVTTDQDGKYTLPTTFDDGDEELVLVATKGDWFTSKHFMVDNISSIEDYGTIILDQQILSEPTVATAADGDRFGVVTVWRQFIDQDIQIFNIEITNARIESYIDPWYLVDTTTGLAGGGFLFSYEKENVSILDNFEFDNGYGDNRGLQILATHRPEVGFCCAEPFKSPDVLKPSPAGFLHPLQEHSGVPLYETTKQLGELSELEDQPNTGEGWHAITPEKTEKAEKISEGLEAGLEVPSKVCGKVGLNCGTGFLLDTIDRLTWLNKLLDGGRREVKIDPFPNTPIVNGEPVDARFDLWNADKPAPFEDSTEAAVVYRVPIETATDTASSYTVQAEWVRPYNNRTQFLTTFSTGSIDVQVKRNQPNLPWKIAEDRSMDITFKNQSLESQTIDSVKIFKEGDLFDERSVNIDLSPSERLELIDFFSIAPLKEESSIRVEVTDTNGNSASRVYSISTANGTSDIKDPNPDSKVEIVNSTLDPSEIDTTPDNHTLEFEAKNISADGTGEDFNDEFEVVFPENVDLEGYSNVSIDAQSSKIEQNGNTLIFSVSPSGGGTVTVSVKMTVVLSAKN